MRSVRASTPRGRTPNLGAICLAGDPLWEPRSRRAQRLVCRMRGFVEHAVDRGRRRVRRRRGRPRSSLGRSLRRGVPRARTSVPTVTAKASSTCPAMSRSRARFVVDDALGRRFLSSSALCGAVGAGPLLKGMQRVVGDRLPGYSPGNSSIGHVVVVTLLLVQLVLLVGRIPPSRNHPSFHAPPRPGGVGR